MQEAKRATRRRHGEQLKRQVLAQCNEPGASVANVALAHGLNANLVHKWRRLDGKTALDSAAIPPPAFVPLALESAIAAKSGEVRIELRRGAISVSATWPLTACSECAAWVREILR
jgi:transposase